MGQYSELIGSFIRTGNYPLEANYIFSTEAALKEFYNLPINKTTLHKGLLKIVANDSELSLYWVIEKDSELQFEKLIESVDIINLTSQLEELKTRLEEHEEDYENLVSSVEDLQIAIDDLAEVVNEDINTLKVLIGITDNQDIIEYLNSLPYDSLTSAYNALLEVKNFLKGYEEGETLKEVELNIKTLIRSLVHNLLTELDLTQIGVGLSGDGSFNSDKETYFLKDATSVMNALKTLDILLNELINNPERLLSESSENDIIIKDNGLFFSISTEYENGILTVNVNGEPKYTHDLGLSAIVEESYYDDSTEKIVIIFKLHSGEVQRVEIPADKLITEWDVEETATVSLNRERVVDGADILTANVKISQEAGNSLQEKVDGLFATGGEAINILPNNVIDDFIIDYASEYGCFCVLWKNLKEALDNNLIDLANSQDALMYMEGSDGTKYMVVESDLNGEVPLENFSFVYKGFLCNGKTKGYSVIGGATAIITDVDLSSRDFLLNNLQCLPVPEGFNNWMEVPTVLFLETSLNHMCRVIILEEYKGDDDVVFFIETPYQDVPLDRYLFSYHTKSNTLSWIEAEGYYQNGSKYYLTIDKEHLRTGNNQYPIVNNAEKLTITAPELLISFPNPKVYVNDIPVDNLSVYDGYWVGQISYNDITLNVETGASDTSDEMQIYLSVAKASGYTDRILVAPELFEFFFNKLEALGLKEFSLDHCIPSLSAYDCITLVATSSPREDWIEDSGDYYPPKDTSVLIQLWSMSDSLFITNSLNSMKYICVNIYPFRKTLAFEIERMEDLNKYAYLTRWTRNNNVFFGNLMSKNKYTFDGSEVSSSREGFFNVYTGEGRATYYSTEGCFEAIKDPFGNTLPVFFIKEEPNENNPDYPIKYFNYYGPEGLTTCSWVPDFDSDGNWTDEIWIGKQKSPAKLEILTLDEYDVIDPKDDNTLHVIP